MRSKVMHAHVPGGGSRFRHDQRDRLAVAREGEVRKNGWMGWFGELRSGPHGLFALTRWIAILGQARAIHDTSIYTLTRKNKHHN